MNCQVKLFARARDLVRQDVVAVTLDDGATVADLRRGLADRHPELRELLSRCAIAVDSEFASDAQPLSSSAEIAILPPVSGG